MKKFALLFLVLLALSVTSAAFAATATIGGETFSLHDGMGTSGDGWATNGSGHLKLFPDYAGGSIAIAVVSGDPTTLYYGDSGDDGGHVTLKGSISVTGGPVMIEAFGIGASLR